MCRCKAHHDVTAQCTCACAEHIALIKHQTYLSQTKVSLSAEDAEVLNNMRPDLLRQWIIEKMLENGAITEFMESSQIPTWASAMEKYITEGNSDPNR